VLDIFLSAPTPVPEDVDLEPQPDGSLEVDGTFVTAPAGEVRSLAARATVELTVAGKRKVLGGQGLIAANRPKTHASVRIDPSKTGLVAGRSYTYRMVLENGRGLLGRSAKRTFTYRPPNVRRGTSGRDRLDGTSWIDVIHAGRGADVVHGLGGNDVLYGEAGDDLLYGERGADRLVGGLGHDSVRAGAQNDVVEVRDGSVDRVWCGTGRDSVKADRRDELHGCEQVKRP
jgi:hypothetical protein